MENKSADSVSMEISFDAPVSELWRAWTDPHFVLQWFGSDPGGKGIDADLNVYPGGKYDIHFRDSDGSNHTCFGIYKEVIEFSKLSFSWCWKSEPGVESFVSLIFIPDGTRTRMQFEHLNFGFQSVHGYEEGWKGAFAKLKKAFLFSTH